MYKIKLVLNKKLSSELSFTTLSQLFSCLLLRLCCRNNADVTLVCVCPLGDPKGVMLTHGNVVADFAGFLKVTDVSDFCKQALSVDRQDLTAASLCVCLQKVIFPNQDDVLISFLPLAHMFERLIEVRPA